MLNLGDHAANRRGVLQLGDPADLVELEADQRRTLRMVAADCAVGLLDLDHLWGLGHRRNSERREKMRLVVYSVPTSASPPTRPDCSVDTLMLRLAAPQPCESWRFRPS